jgi:hypothetical protein
MCKPVCPTGRDAGRWVIGIISRLVPKTMSFSIVVARKPQSEDPSCPPLVSRSPILRNLMLAQGMCSLPPCIHAPKMLWYDAQRGTQAWSPGSHNAGRLSRPTSAHARDGAASMLKRPGTAPTGELRTKTLPGSFDTYAMTASSNTLPRSAAYILGAACRARAHACLPDTVCQTARTAIC